MSKSIQDDHPAEQPTKERLLEAAIRVFAEKGFQGATVREICQEAGSNVAAVNYHFGDKERLYNAVLWQVFSEHEAARDFNQAQIGDLAPEERLAELIRGEIRYLYQEKCKKECSGQHFSLFLMEMAHPSPFLGQVVQNFIRPNHDLALSLLQEYLGPQASREVLERCTDSIWGQILHNVFVWPIDTHLRPDRLHPSKDLEKLAEHIVTFSLNGLKAIKRNLDTQRNPS